MSSMKLKQRTGSMKLKQRTGRIEQANVEIPNYFGPDKVGFVSLVDVEILDNYDGYETVYKFDADENSSYEDIFSVLFKTSDFPDYAEADHFLQMEFWAKWDEVPSWGARGVWVEKPAPDPNKYQKYILKSDRQNQLGEYFRVYFRPESNALAFITDVKVYKVSPPEYLFDT